MMGGPSQSAMCGNLFTQKTNDEVSIKSKGGI